MSIFVFLLATAACGGPFPQESLEREVAASVDGYEITKARVSRYLEKKLSDKEIPADMMVRLSKEATDHLVNRHLVLLAVESSGIEIGPSQIKYEISKLEDRLKEIDKTLDDHFAETGINQTELDYEYRWQLAWEKYLEKYLTNSNLEKHYNRNRRQFDGTEVRLAHVLLSNQSENAFEKAIEIREQVTSGKISWSQAVKENSIAESSSNQGGDVGWNNFHGPMVPRFCQAGIRLNKGEISEPVATRFGIHLIKCTDVRPGKIGLGDTRQAVKRDAMRFLFETLAAKQKPKSEIKIAD